MRPTYAGRMRAIQITGFGPPEGPRDGARSDAAPGQVRVRIHAVGVNFSDTERRRAGSTRPSSPGSRAARPPG